MSSWTKWAIDLINAEHNRVADTHLLRVMLPFTTKIHLYLKDESTHHTGSLKHRLARSLFLYAICNGLIKEGTTVVEASSGNTAISEAYFAQLLNLPFIAVIPKNTSHKKIEQIEYYQGKCHFVKDASLVYDEAERLALSTNGHYIDQFTYAERATDWRGNNNIAESLFTQLEKEAYPTPTWLVMSAGTGGTSATLGRYIKYRGMPTQLCVADPERSVFYEYYNTRKVQVLKEYSRIEGVGRPRAERSFVPTVIDRMIQIPDAASFATVRFLDSVLGRKWGSSTGTNVYALFTIISEMMLHSQEGSVVSFICDGGTRYMDTTYSDKWLRSQHIDIAPYLENLSHFYRTGYLSSLSPDHLPTSSAH